MTTDNRTNEPTEAQVEAARRARNSHDFVGHGKCRCGLGGFTSIGHGKHQARAALVAAQGAEPQAEPDPYQVVRVLHEHQRDTSVMSRVKCVCGVTCDDRSSHRLHQAELIAHLQVVPVLPSSGVDEEKLAEVIEQARDRSRKGRDISKESLGQYIARIVNERRAEWLKEQWR